MKQRIVDVREPFEFAMRSVDGAVNIPLRQLPGAVKNNDLNEDDELILYCNSGSRSSQAAAFLQAQGYKNVVNGINQSTVEQNFC